MNERGVVTKIEGAMATVHFSMGETCFGCEAQGDCSKRDRAIEARIPEELSIREGDWVEVALPSGTWLSGVLWLLLVPLGLFGTGYALVRSLAPEAGEGPAGLAGLGGFALGLGLATLATRSGRLRRAPVVSSRLDGIPDSGFEPCARPEPY